MPTMEIDEFAKLLVLYVRDEAIQACDSNYEAKSNNPISKRWRDMKESNADAIVAELIPDCIDIALFYLMKAIDNGDIRLTFTSAEGKAVDLEDEGKGELAGWYLGDENFRARFSKERYTDFVALMPPFVTEFDK